MLDAMLAKMINERESGRSGQRRREGKQRKSWLIKKQWKIGKYTVNSELVTSTVVLLKSWNILRTKNKTWIIHEIEFREILFQFLVFHKVRFSTKMGAHKISLKCVPSKWKSMYHSWVRGRLSPER